MKRYKTALRSGLAALVEPIATKLGYVNKRKFMMENSVGKEAMADHFFELLVRSGFHPNHVLDIGANRGTWTKKSVKYFPDASYTMVEPQYWLKSSFDELLKNKKMRLFNVGVGARNGTFPFTIADQDDSSSFFNASDGTENKEAKQVMIEMKTIDELLRTNDLPVPEMIKIDAEGLDMEVLKGARSCVGQTEVILMEAEVVGRDYPNTALRVMNYLDSLKYMFFDITELNRPFASQALWLAELAFVRKDGEIAKLQYA